MKTFILFSILLLFLASCKKDELMVNKPKRSTLVMVVSPEIQKGWFPPLSTKIIKTGP